MPHFEISDRETEILAAALRSYLSDLGMEIADTERKEMRDRMKEEKEFLSWFVGRIDPGGPAPGSDTLR